MRYMMLIYTQELQNRSPEEMAKVFAGHLAVQQETKRRGVFCAADPLQTTAAATTVRVQDGKVLVTDGPFAETKEQLAGYYILECKDLTEAIDWAKRIPTACQGGDGSVEIRRVEDIRKM